MKLNRLHNLIFLLAVLAWSLTIGGFFAWDMRVARGHAEALAIKEARSNFNKDLAFRLWATSHGGVYVPRNERTPPNPGLAHLPERDITTPSGVSLTLMNPAYMLRQLMEEYGDFYGIRGRIVSANPLNPSNSPDPWESRALRRFEQGAEEVMEFQLAGEQSVLRLMRPMHTERGCLKCHAVQGYKVGDLRGGIGVTVPMAPYLATLKETRRNRMLFFGAIWVFGVIAIFLLDRQVLQRLRAQELHESELREKSLALERANADLTRLAEVSAHHLMEPSRRLVTYSKILQHELAEHPKEEVGTALGFIQDNACYLRNLVRDIRHYLSAGEARVPPATHDPGEAAAQVWKRLNTLVAQSGGEIEIGELPPAFCDQPRLHELLTVLLENALIHAGAGKQPRIKFSGENEGEWNRYRLTDNGPGMPGVYRKRVLEIFERLSTVGKEQSKGTGIGLAIARRIVESMGGEIKLEAGEAGGLMVVFTLPAAFAPGRLPSLCTRLLVFLALCLLALPAAAAPVVEHRLRVILQPEAHALEVTDTLVWPEAPATDPVFTLHAGLQPTALNGAQLELLGRDHGGIPLERYRLKLASGARRVTLRYGGRLHHPLDDFGEGVGRGRQQTPGYIAEDGVFLGGASGWVPTLEAGERMTFTLEVQVPAGWSSVSQGVESAGEGGRGRWVETHPQQEIYLVAGRFQVSRQAAGPAEARVYLREAEPELAHRYLEATGDYLQLFSALMGEYPYGKFALVSNFWETGYGMPSFTLLGPRVLRLPFIIHSSYPHEIVHNWWGNGVFVDYQTGNWSEGLTAYMADHLLKERQGQGAEYRRGQLQKYAEHVFESRDFPLTAFTSRHSGASQAIGYGKSLMLFHMLRLRLGDKVFLAGLRHFYREHRFTEASFADIRRSFEAVSGQALRDFFRHWTERSGAPRLQLDSIQVDNGELSLVLTQETPGGAMPLQVPVAIRLADGSMVEQRVALAGERAEVSLPLPGEVQCVAVDPRFDLFRRLLPAELPVSLDSLLGAERLLLVVPSQGPKPLLQAYRQLAAGWAAGEPGVTVRADNELPGLPVDRPVWLLGWMNRFRGRLPAVSGSLQVEADSLHLAGRRWPRDGHSFVITAAREDAAPLAWLAADVPSAVAGLARKVPHYGKYGYLVFSGEEPDNRVQGQWPATGSPLVHRFDGQSGGCDLPPREPLARLARPASGGSGGSAVKVEP